MFLNNLIFVVPPLHRDKNGMKFIKVCVNEKFVQEQPKLLNALNYFSTQERGFSLQFRDDGTRISESIVAF